ncbi:MAG: gliding motility protein GldN [Flammeovirgaceae bacterium]
MLKSKKFLFVMLALLLIASGLFAQGNNGQYNEWSINAIRKDDQMFRKSLWFRVDMREKQNVPFFAEGNEITRLLIDAVKMGSIRPFKNDSLTQRMSLEEFEERLRIPADKGDDDFLDEKFEENDEIWTEDGGKGSSPKAEEGAGPDEYLPKQLYVIELKEDLIFDKLRSRMYEDLLAVTIIIPGEQTNAGIDRELCTFSYKELCEQVFANNPNAVWNNPRNAAQSHNLKDAFTLHLWHGTLVKYQSPKNNRIVDMYTGGKAALMAAQRAIAQLMEYEALLWEE